MKFSNISVLAIAAGILIFLGFLFVISAGTLWNGDERPDDSSTVSAESLIGKQAPSFSFTDAAGETYTNAMFRGKSVVLFFNEGLRCYPACWNAMIALGEDPRFTQDDTVAYSVVVDAYQEWRRAAEKVPELQKVNVLFDTNGAASRAFGMLSEPSSMHIGSLPGHTYVILDDFGVVRSVLDDPRMGIRNDELAEALSTLNSGVRL